jgi:hypothetical protein
MFELPIASLAEHIKSLRLAIALNDQFTYEILLNRFRFADDGIRHKRNDDYENTNTNDACVINRTTKKASAVSAGTQLQIDSATELNS